MSIWIFYFKKKMKSCSSAKWNVEIVRETEGERESCESCDLKDSIDE